MAEGIASTLNTANARRWLARGRTLVENIPNLKSQALEAKRSSRWLPNDDFETAEILYVRAVSTEHIIVQVRSISRTLFDLSIQGEVPERVRRELALALSTASFAVSDKAESDDLEETANDLRASATILRDSLIKQSNLINSDVLVKLASIVSNLDVIANSLDESSPAITDVLTPDEPAEQNIIKKNWFKKLWNR